MLLAREKNHVHVKNKFAFSAAVVQLIAVAVVDIDMRALFFPELLVITFPKTRGLVIEWWSRIKVFFLLMRKVVRVMSHELIDL